MPHVAEYIARVTGTRKWVVANRLTGSLRAKGYDLAISPARYRDLEAGFQRETYGAPLKNLRDAAPDLLEALEGLLEAVESDHPRADRAGWAMQARAAIAKAKGTA